MSKHHQVHCLVNPDSHKTQCGIEGRCIDLTSSQRSEFTPSSLISSTIGLWFKTEEVTGRYVFLLVTLSQTGRAKEAGREGRNRKVEVFS